MNWQELRALFDSATTALRAYRGSLRLLRPVTLDRDATHDFETTAADNPLVRRFPKSEQARMLAETRAEKEAKRREAGSIARHKAQEVRTIAAQGKATIAKARRDPLLSMPDATDHVTADGTISLALLEVQMQPLLEAADQTRRMAIYEAALQRKDARALVEVSIIERLDGKRRSRPTSTSVA